MTDLRKIAYQALLTTEETNRTHTLSKDVLDKYSYLGRQERSFIKRMIEGTIERRITIDHVLELYSKVPVRKMKRQVRTLLRMGVYQLLYMDNVTEYAAVNETVTLAKKSGAGALSGFINGVLRSIAKDIDHIAWPERENDIVKYLSVAYSCPEWIVKKLTEDHGEKNAETLLKLSVSVRPLTARVNLSKSSPNDIAASGIGTVSDILPYAVILEDYDNIADIPAFSNGLICIQDISSMLVCHLAKIKEDDHVLDLCAAPGGKSLHAADIANKGKVYSFDVSEKKIAKIEENVKRCGFTNIETKTGDATVFDPKLEGGFDVVLADVPCSGLGVMGRKNDIKYNITPEAADELADIQKKILKNAAKYVKDGGTLMFSTCTCLNGENEDNMRYLTKECGLTAVGFENDLPEALYDESAKDGYIQLYGKDGKTDGFFIGKLTK
ncbi:MAG: 16S rRNA (cytosine(967)-C(5))-methyltransferase RsmB [Lachnospiraceae bacterium]|nr:16S rRNA (cytosine(967)-C(5))-methyltransferase RsmB [Lachnospiraceae bacterium]